MAKVKAKAKFKLLNPKDFNHEQLIDIYKHKVQIWTQAEERAKQYLMEARKRRKQAELELRKVTK